MIKIAGLPDGAHTLTHPRGPVWLLVRKGEITRAELWDRDHEAVYYWSARGQRTWPPLKRIDPNVVKREVVLPG
jgi:hypothetical protein